MILNNPTTQQILEIANITNGIIYTLYENTHYRSIEEGERYSLLWQMDKNLMPDANLSFKDNELKLAYEHLLTLPEFTGFELIEDEKAWTLTSKPLRLFINNDQILKSIDGKDGLNTIIERLRDENAQASEKFIFRGKTQTVLYLAEIMSSDESVVTPLINDTIFIENK